MDPGSSRRLALLDALGIDVWVSRAQTAVAETAPVAAAASEAPIDTLDWPDLRARVAECTRCELHRGRTQTVFGVGDTAASWLVIGEAPGAEEDRSGEPFVGRAGRLLTSMLRAIGLKREQVYIANILKCRPPGNRDPKAQEIVCCEKYLMRQIALIEPQIILALGRVAAQNLLKSDAPIGRMRGRLHHFGEAAIPVVVTYHPAYLLRSPTEKRKTWQDLQLALKVVKGGTESEI